MSALDSANVSLSEEITNAKCRRVEYGEVDSTLFGELRHDR